MSDQLAYSNSNPDVFSVKTECTLVNGSTTLKHNTWEMHIKPGHPEVATALDHIQRAIEAPTYVAYSLPGKSGSLSGNLVFVSEAAALGRANLHVFVETPATKPTVGTAMYCRKPRHSQIVWRVSADALQASYDKDVDTLYLSKEKPRAALTEEDDDGLLLRFSLDDDAPCGVTIHSFKSAWSGHQPELAHKVASFLGVSASAAEHLLLSINPDGP